MVSPIKTNLSEYLSEKAGAYLPLDQLVRIVLFNQANDRPDQHECAGQQTEHEPEAAACRVGHVGAPEDESPDQVHSAG